MGRRAGGPVGAPRRTLARRVREVREHASHACHAAVTYAGVLGSGVGILVPLGGVVGNGHVAEFTIAPCDPDACGRHVATEALHSFVRSCVARGRVEGLHRSVRWLGGSARPISSWLGDVASAISSRDERRSSPTRLVRRFAHPRRHDAAMRTPGVTATMGTVRAVTLCHELSHGHPDALAIVGRTSASIVAAIAVS